MKPEIKNMKKAAERILKAVKKKERIIVYGDADLDGVASVIVLKEAIKNLGGNIVAVYFPDRETEGYGISGKGVETLKVHAPALLVAVDCGISNFKEIKAAKKMKLETVVIDHHEVLSKLPDASIIVDPKQKGDKYPFKEFAAVGLAFKLSEAMLGAKMTDTLKKNFLELTAIATIADMMPQKEDNETLVQEGLCCLESSWRPGIKTFLEAEEFKSCSGLREKVSKIISILNVRDIEDGWPASYRLLASVSEEEAKKLITKLLAENKLRREKVDNIIETVEERMAEKKERLIFEGDESFESVLMSSAASILSQRHQKPAFLYKKMAEESQGTVRAPKGINTVDLMKKCSKLLITYGGHPAASGFRVKNGKLEEFRNCLIKNFHIK